MRGEPLRRNPRPASACLRTHWRTSSVTNARSGGASLGCNVTVEDHEQRWREWLSTIDQDITTVYLFRATWLTVGDIVRTNSNIRPSHFFAYMASIYGTSQALALRRLADER